MSVCENATKLPPSTNLSGFSALRGLVGTADEIDLATVDANVQGIRAVERRVKLLVDQDTTLHTT